VRSRRANTKDQQKRLGLFCEDRELLSGKIITGRTPSKKLHFYVSNNFGSLDGLCPRLYDRPDLALFQYIRDNLRDKYGLKVRG
jgi:hypothetical protein